MNLRTSYHALSPHKQLLWNLVRFFIPGESRFFFEGSREIRGQMWMEERRLLFETVLSARPKVAFESGTWEGGGSTWFIAHALKANGNGILHTAELDRRRYERAKASYEHHAPDLLEHVEFHHGDSSSVFPPILAETGRCDLLFLDGAQDPLQTSRELAIFKPYLRSGSVLVMHDWDNEKMRDVRPQLEADTSLDLRTVLTQPVSVGLAVLQVR